MDRAESGGAETVDLRGQDAYGERGPDPTCRTWLAAVLVGVVVGVLWAIPLLFLFDVWFLAMPVWLVIMLAVSGIVFLCGISSRRAIAYGVGLLLSVPVTLGAMAAFIAIAWRVSGGGRQ